MSGFHVIVRKPAGRIAQRWSQLHHVVIVGMESPDNLAIIENMKRKKTVPPKSVATGQTWQMTDSNIEITLVGRTLVHYKHLKPGVKRAPTLLLNKTALEEFLRKTKAVLVRGTGTRSQREPQLSATA